MKALEYKHYFKVIGGKFVWENPDVFQFVKQSLEGKRGFAIIKEIEEDISPNQFAYYFGGIIRRECMNSEVFSGMKEHEIHSFLLKTLRGTIQSIMLDNGKIHLIERIPDFANFGKKEMARYIEETIAYLQVEFDIHPKPAEHYKYNKYYIKPKVFKHEDLEGDT